MYSWVVDILPYIDNQEAYNAWNRTLPYNWVTPDVNDATIPTNAVIGNTPISILKCPDDNTAQPGTGYLSYVVNGGYSLWHGNSGAGVNPLGWVGTATGGTVSTTLELDWLSGVATKVGVMFLGTTQGNLPWDIKTSPSSIVDGSSTTLLLTENTLAGASTGTAHSGQIPTNWATPLPSFIMFLASDNVCNGGSGIVGTGKCGTAPSGQLTPTGGTIDGAGWALANKVGTFENINGGQTITDKGSFPYPNSGHPGGINVFMCDGSGHFISNTIDGTVWSKLMTPQGSKLPSLYKQLPVASDVLQ
jgi:prepilin-type processing-associated H-X9-DG protein